MPLPNTDRSSPQPETRVAALVSGGLDSTVMAVQLAEDFERVYPIYVRCGLVWEESEQRSLARFLERVAQPRIRAVRILDFPMGDLYGNAWYTSGSAIPSYDEPDELWEIPGRNLILLAKAALWCQLHSVSTVALGTLKSNPFPDATPQFFSALERAVRRGLNQSLKILTPLSTLGKEEVIRSGRRLPLELTLSCAQTSDDRHCGTCGKCRERRDAFELAGVPDPTPYTLDSTDPATSAETA